jgi:uncharacterized membrane-anchored protein YjiN (DUF445 family)
MDYIPEKKNNFKNNYLHFVCELFLNISSCTLEKKKKKPFQKLSNLFFKKRIIVVDI